MQDLALNVDITKIQYNMGKMYEEARKLGFNGDELEEYGLCLKGSKGSCKSATADSVKLVEQIYEKADK